MPEQDPVAPGRLLVGCAGWNIPKASEGHFSGIGSHLERYSDVFSAVEINSSFYRPHRRTTYSRWRATVPSDFRFSVKLPKVVTHEERLTLATDRLNSFIDEVTGLEEKLGCLLVQLPPSLKFDEAAVNRFFSLLRESTDARVACEPRHPSWFGESADNLFRNHRVARVAADPAVISVIANEPGGATESVYYRLHGSPKMYYSAYEQLFLDSLGRQLSRRATNGSDVWCIFDNTALGAATENALTVVRAQ